MASSNNNNQGTMIMPPSSKKTDVIMASLRHEITRESAAQTLGISATEVEKLEGAFIAAGTTALVELFDSPADGEGQTEKARDQVSQMGALNVISQSLSAILTLAELLNTTLETLHWVFGYIPSIGVIEDADLVMK